MTPYYDDGSCVIYHGDCRRFLPIQSGATITDPPYGTGKYLTDTNVFDSEMLNALADTTLILAVFGYPERLVRLCVKAGRTPDEWITWWPTNGSMKGPSLVATALPRECEVIACFGVGQWSRLRRARSGTEGFTFDLERSGKNSFLGTSRQNLTEDARLGDVWREPSPGIGFNSRDRLHPNMKPLGVLARLVLALSDPGDMILDPFMGSGTTLLAAKTLGRKSIGIEIEERYCEIAARRLGQEVLAL